VLTHADPTHGTPHAAESDNPGVGLLGYGGADTMTGGAGDDAIDGGEGSDVIVGDREKQIGVQGAHLNPLGLFLNPLSLFLRTV
jgi:Ca2+-binding RTX toxin-like protein